MYMYMHVSIYIHIHIYISDKTKDSAGKKQSELASVKFS